ncbi:cell division protein FtsL [Enterococcus canis]|uniref:Cell division protein FtsL n=1 Tax=Enterococcus canis TaxID=214095 RepID=A0A1L8RD94_9ENTE|nr:cell division protein FtsL [Enterococcus canis]OJG17713.1 cell division protein FtsL [Enterococcus canis]
MAELKKFEEYQLDIPVIAEPAKDQPIEIEVTTTSPKKKLRHITYLERIVVMALVVAGVALAVMTIQMRTSVNQTLTDIGQIQNEVNTTKTDITRLEQEKGELSRADRVQKIAKEKGLKDHADNIRKVK